MGAERIEPPSNLVLPLTPSIGTQELFGPSPEGDILKPPAHIDAFHPEMVRFFRSYTLYNDRTHRSDSILELGTTILYN